MSSNEKPLAQQCKFQSMVQRQWKDSLGGSELQEQQQRVGKWNLIGGT
jgi:hypothetical protein